MLGIKEEFCNSNPKAEVQASSASPLTMEINVTSPQ